MKDKLHIIYKTPLEKSQIQNKHMPYKACPMSMHELELL